MPIYSYKSIEKRRLSPDLKITSITTPQEITIKETTTKQIHIIITTMERTTITKSQGIIIITMLIITIIIL